MAEIGDKSHETMTCPITNACYKILEAAYVSSGTWTFMHEDEHDDFKALKSEIDQDDPVLQSQALRAFFAFEYMYFYLLPLKITSSEHLRWKRNFQEQFERSCEGLDLLIRTCEQTKRRIVVDKGTLSLMSRDRSEFNANTMDKPLWVIDAIVDAAERLKKYMAGSEASLSSIGEWLGHALYDSNQSLPNCGDLIRTMLSISIHNPVSPCNTMKKYQA